MQANWSLILNIVLLVGVIIAIARTMNARRKHVVHTPSSKPSLEAKTSADVLPQDDVIAVRAVPTSNHSQDIHPLLSPVSTVKSPLSRPIRSPEAVSPPSSLKSTLDELGYSDGQSQAPSVKLKASSAPIVLMLLAKDQRQLAGYELLQTVLSSGLRFGEGQLFHRHQYPNGQGPVLCSLAAATPSGVFDLQQMGAFSVRGLCLFMHTSGSAAVDMERFEIMLDTAKLLSEGLDAHLLDDQRRPLTTARLQRYYQRIRESETLDARLEETA